MTDVFMCVGTLMMQELQSVYLISVEYIRGFRWELQQAFECLTHLHTPSHFLSVDSHCLGQCVALTCILNLCIKIRKHVCLDSYLDLFTGHLVISITGYHHINLQLTARSLMELRGFFPDIWQFLRSSLGFQQRTVSISPGKVLHQLICGNPEPRPGSRQRG